MKRGLSVLERSILERERLRKQGKHKKVVTSTELIRARAKWGNMMRFEKLKTQDALYASVE